MSTRTCPVCRLGGGAKFKPCECPPAPKPDELTVDDVLKVIELGNRFSSIRWFNLDDDRDGSAGYEIRKPQDGSTSWWLFNGDDETHFVGTLSECILEAKRRGLLG